MPVSEDEVEKATMDLKGKFSAGMDGVPDLIEKCVKKPLILEFKLSPCFEYCE
jgi:hypothetical protein